MPIEIENRQQLVGAILLLIALVMLIGIPVIGVILNWFPGGETGLYVYGFIIFVLIVLGVVLRKPKAPVIII